MGLAGCFLREALGGGGAIGGHEQVAAGKRGATRSEAQAGAFRLISGNRLGHGRDRAHPRPRGRPEVFLPL